ncbi:UNVERIFIED_CONTAM: hypothetical protein K2H54_015054 [Gekko kuhli]
MSDGKETITPATSGDMAPVTTVLTTCPLEEGTDLGKPRLEPFEKFMVNWGHLFPDDERHMDYISSRMRDGAADWYVSLHNVNSPVLQMVDAFMWALYAQYEDTNASEQARAFLRTFKQVLYIVQPVSLLAWMREAADAENRLWTIQIDNATFIGKGAPMTPRPKVLKAKEEVVE